MKYLLLLSFSVLSFIATADLVVVMPKNADIDSLSEAEVANIFLARTNRLPNGSKTFPIELKQANFKAAFYQHISGKTQRQLMSYWTTLVFTGKGRPPKTYTDIKALEQKFNENSNAISYVQASQLTSSMKVVYRVPN